MSGLENRLAHDLLCQLVEGQTKHAEQLAKLEGHIVTRVDKLETAATRNFWVTYIVAPVLAVAHGVAAHYGIKL